MGIRNKARGADRSKPERPTGPVLADSDIEEGDIEALVRSKLQPGEYILGDGAAKDNQGQQIVARGICNKPQLLQKLADLEYKVPEGAKRVPWVDTLTIDGTQLMPKGVAAKDGVKLESTFLGLATEAAREAYRRLRVMRIPCSRPTDFYAEMMRPDKQMYKVRSRASEEERRIKVVEDRKKSHAAKKFAKKARSKKLEARAQEKRQTLTDIDSWKQKNRAEGTHEDSKDLDDILDRQKRGKNEQTEGPRRKGEPKLSKKRKGYDDKFGFGGKKKRMKQNDSSSVNDFSGFPGARGKGKGKGKGKSKGQGKGKGSGKGGGKSKGSGKGKGGGKKGKR